MLGRDPYHGPGHGAHGLCFSGATRGGSAFAAEHLQGNSRATRGSLRPATGWLIPVGEARDAAAELGADGRGRPRRFGTRARVGKVSPTTSSTCSTAARRPRLPALGQLCAGQGPVIDPRRHRVLKRRILAAVRASRLHRLRAFLRGERLPRAPRRYLPSTGRCRRARNFDASPRDNGEKERHSKKNPRRSGVGSSAGGTASQGQLAPSMQVRPY